MPDSCNFSDGFRGNLRAEFREFRSDVKEGFKDVSQSMEKIGVDRESRFERRDPSKSLALLLLGLTGVSVFFGALLWMQETIEGLQRTVEIANTRPVQTTQTVLKPIKRAETYTVDVPVKKTILKDEEYTVRRPVTQTVLEDESYKVQRPVYETSERQEWRTVRKPIRRTTFLDKEKTVTEPVTTWEWEWRFEDGYPRWVLVPVSTYVARTVVEKVPVETLEYEDIIETRRVPTRTVRYVEETKTRKVPVETTRYVEETKTRKVPIETTEYVQEQRTRWVTDYERVIVPSSPQPSVDPDIPANTAPRIPDGVR